MPFFNYPVRRFRRRERKHFPNTPGNVANASMRNELDRLVKTVPNPTSKKLFISEMQSFLHLYSRYLARKPTAENIDWQKVSTPRPEQIVSYETLPEADDNVLLKKLAVLRVNGGLGSTMGMVGAKSALEVKDNMTFLDLAVQQIKHLNSAEHVDVPLLLMTSFNTQEDTIRIVKKYANQHQVRITTFNQSRYPKIYDDTLLLVPKSVDDDRKAWYPPGHGDLYLALHRSGVLDQLLTEGKEYLFVSNSDNLGAVVDSKILRHMVETEAEFLVEVTNRTKADVKGGTLIDYNGTLQFLEIAQVPSGFLEEFESVKKFKSFSTNNIWVNLKALKRVMETQGMELDVFAKQKVTEDGRSALQLETAVGSAIKHFKNSHGINVPRSRFLPVKNCSDLLLVKSDLYSPQNGRLVLSEQRMFGTTPVIKLGDHFKKIEQFQKRLRYIPRMLELDHLTVTGDVYFGRNVTLRGTVIIVAGEGQRLDIPDGCVLENRLISGGLMMTEL